MKVYPYPLNGRSGHHGHRRTRPAVRAPRRWQDWVNLLLGLWLLAAPWVWRSGLFDLSAAPGSGWGSWVPGALIVLAAAWALARPARALPEYAAAAVGFWLFLSPWIPDGARVVALPTWNQWAVGTVVFVLALWAA